MCFSFIISIFELFLIKRKIKYTIQDWIISVYLIQKVILFKTFHHSLVWFNIIFPKYFLKYNSEKNHWISTFRDNQNPNKTLTTVKNVTSILFPLSLTNMLPLY